MAEGHGGADAGHAAGAEDKRVAPGDLGIADLAVGAPQVLQGAGVPRPVARVVGLGILPLLKQFPLGAPEGQFGHGLPDGLADAGLEVALLGAEPVAEAFGVAGGDGGDLVVGAQDGDVDVVAALDVLGLHHALFGPLLGVEEVGDDGLEELVELLLDHLFGGVEVALRKLLRDLLPAVVIDREDHRGDEQNHGHQAEQQAPADRQHDPLAQRVSRFFRHEPRFRPGPA
ncbi:MAG: hypothetical protein M5U26_15900 [Planctomycetota bacterium]|nr:hypothetical protein [Planctomycetota bacterium]